MRNWFRKRYDARHTTARPSLARRLRIEHCEDRRMLAAASLTDSPAAVTSISEGGFISFSASGFQLSDANVNQAGNFAFDFSGNTVQLQEQLTSIPNSNGNTVLDAVITRGVGQKIEADSANVASGTAVTNLDFSSIAVSEIVKSYQAFDSAGEDLTATFESPRLGPVYDFQRGDLDLDTPIFLRPSANDGEQLTGNDAPPGLPSASPGIEGETAIFHSIPDLIQIAHEPSSANRRAPIEGGTLQVFEAVSTAQQEYEAQLLAQVAYELHQAGELSADTNPAIQTRPVVAELARAVAFETVSYHTEAKQTDVKVEANSAATDGVTLTPLPNSPYHSLPTATRPLDSSAGDDLSRSNSPLVVQGEQQSGRSNATQSDMTVPAATQVERIDNEQDTASAANLSKWPMLASAVILYLAVDHRRPLQDQAVQTPPRREREGSRPPSDE